MIVLKNASYVTDIVQPVAILKYIVHKNKCMNIHIRHIPLSDSCTPLYIKFLSTDLQFVSHFKERQLSLRPSSCHFDLRFRALCTSPLVLIFKLRPFQYQICPFNFHMFVDPLPATSTLSATLLGATFGAREVAALTGQVQAVTQVLAVVQQDPVLIIHLVLLDAEENSNLHLVITSLHTVKP